MLLRNLPRLGGYTQWVRLGAHPILDLQQQWAFMMSTKGLRPVRQDQLGPLALRGLTEVDLCTSLPSGVPEPGRLPCSVTRLRLLGVQDSAVRGKGSPVDQDERLQLEARISRDFNRPPSL